MVYTRYPLTTYVLQKYTRRHESGRNGSASYIPATSMTSADMRKSKA